MDFLRTGLVAGVALFSLIVQAEEPRISLSAENEPLGQVLQRIEKSSGVDVVLSDQKWAKDPVSFSVKNSDVEKALDSALRPYDYVLEWYAGETDFSKVVVTVHERKAQIEVTTIPEKLKDKEYVKESLADTKTDYSNIPAFPTAAGDAGKLSVEEVIKILKNSSTDSVTPAFPPGSSMQGVSLGELELEIKKVSKEGGK